MPAVCAECLGGARGGCTNLIGLPAGKRQILKGTHSCVSESCLSRHLTKHKYRISNYIVDCLIRRDRTSYTVGSQ